MTLRRFPGVSERVFLSLLLLSVLPAACPAQESSNGAAAPVGAARAEAYLRERLAVWQRRLRLDEWTISVILSRADALRPKTLGNIRWDPGQKTAEIRVLEPDAASPLSRKALEDMEYTVVHELIHLTLSSLPRSEASHPEEERAVNRIASALLLLDRAD